MSCDVSMIVIRCDDHVPWDRFYLGGNGTERALRDAFSASSKQKKKIINYNGDVYYPLSFEEAMFILTRHQDDFYTGSYHDDAIKFLDEHVSKVDDFVLFLEIL